MLDEGSPVYWRAGKSLVDINNNLPERSPIQMIERSGKIGKWITRIHDRLDPIQVDRANQSFERPAAASPNPMYGDVLEHQRHGGGAQVEAIQRADLANMTADRRKLYRFAQMRAADDFQNMVRAAIPGQLVDRFYPILPIAVDIMVCAQSPRTRLIGSLARDNDLRAMRLGDLQAE
jgi:hypothetical protein